MLNAFHRIPGAGWITAQFYERADLVQAAQFPADIHAIPGGSPYAYVIVGQSVYLVNRQNNTLQEVNLGDQNAQGLQQRLRLEPLTNEQPLRLIEESASIERIRAVMTATGLVLPRTMMPIINTLVISTFFGFGPYAWIAISPIVLAYFLYQAQNIRQGLSQFLRNFRQNMTNLPFQFGEWAADFALRHYVGIFKVFCSLSILLFLGLNSWSIVAIYGLYRYPDQDWLQFFKNALTNIQSFGFGFFHRAVGRRSFYIKLGMGCMVALYLAIEAYTGGALAVFTTGAFLLQIVAVGIGFKALFRDLLYTVKNPIKVLLSHSGKIWGALWGRFLAYSVFTGRVEGTIGPAVGHVIQNGIFSGIFSSFLMPSGWFTTHQGFLFIARLQNLFNSVVTSIFITTEMQTQGTFYGTVGPTLVQLFAFMFLGCVVGYFAERLVNYVNPIVGQETPRVVAATLRQAEIINNGMINRSYFSLWHIAYVGAMTPLMMQTPIGAAMIVFAGGHLAAGTLLTALLATMTYGAMRLAVSGIRRIRGRTQAPIQQQPVQQPQINPPVTQPPAAIPQTTVTIGHQPILPVAPEVPVDEAPVLPITPTFTQQQQQAPNRRQTRSQTRMQQQAQLPENAEQRMQM